MVPKRLLGMLCINHPQLPQSPTRQPALQRKKHGDVTGNVATIGSMITCKTCEAPMSFNGGKHSAHE